MGRTTPLTSKRCILSIYPINVGTEYFKHALYCPFFSLQNAVCFIMLTCLVPVLATFYIQGVLKFLKNYSGAKGIMGTGSFPGVKSGQGVTLTTNPLLMPWSIKSIAIPVLPLWAVRRVQSLSACTRVRFIFLFFYIGSRVKYPLFLSVVNETCFLSARIR